jgi:hypothetical protein
MTNENIPCNFHVGQKVVCINATGTFSLAENVVYTVSMVDSNGGIASLDGSLQAIGIGLVEARPNPGDYAFDARRFRPVVTRKSDISVFKAMLKPSKTRVPA